MNKSKFAALVVALTSVVMAAPAAAQSFYFGGSIGNTEAHEAACQGAPICDRSDTTYGGHIGYMLTPNWGLEFTYRDLGKTVESSDGAGNTAQWKTKTADVVVVAALPFSQIGLGDSLSVYGKAGAYYAKTKLESNFLVEDEAKSKQWTYGFGVRWNVFRHVALRAEWQRYNNVGGKEVGMRSDINVMTGGLLIFF